MIKELNKIEKLEKFVEEKQKEIEPIRNLIGDSFREAEKLKKDLVEKYVQKTHEFTLDKVVEYDSWEIKRFTIISVDFHTETELLLELEDGGQISDFLSHSAIFNLFIHTPDYKRIIRKENLKTVLDNE